MSSSDNIVSSSNSIHGFYITYDRLKIIDSVFMNSAYANSDNLNIYIDMSSATKELYFNRPPINGGAEISSTIINMCAHYREYYDRCHKVKTKFFIVFSNNTPEYMKRTGPTPMEMDGYNSNNIALRKSHPEITDMISEACTLLDVICPFLPDIFFIRSEHDDETSVIIYDSILREMEKSGNSDHNADMAVPSMIISKDPHTFLLPAFLKCAYVLRPAKQMPSRTINPNIRPADISYIVSMQTLSLDMRKTQEKYKINIHEDGPMFPGDLKRIFMIRGMASRSIPPLMSEKDTFKIVTGARWLRSDNSSPFTDLYKTNPFMYNREFAFDVVAQLHETHSRDAISIDRYNINVTNIYNPEMVKVANETVYRLCPLMLNKL
jgi:hypothetical protein